MGLVLLSIDSCYGCDEPVYVYCDEASGREVERDGALWGTPGPRHRCADERVRERINLTPLEFLLAYCASCGASDVAYTTWGRLVECPSASWTSMLWDEPYELHVCVPDRKAPRTQPRQPGSARKARAVVAGVDVPEL